jgi:hypothetical protein
VANDLQRGSPRKGNVIVLHHPVVVRYSQRVNATDLPRDQCSALIKVEVGIPRQMELRAWLLSSFSNSKTF